MGKSRVCNGTHEFYSSLSTGKIGERRLDSFFSTWYNIETVPLADELKYGVDRIFYTPENVTYSVEYKTDARAEKTGNAFVEIVSNDKINSQGWALKSQAQILIYFVHPLIYVLEMAAIKRRLAEWRRKYRTVSVPNVDKNGLLIYSSHGILVPLKEFTRDCLKTLNLKGRPL